MTYGLQSQWTNVKSQIQEDTLKAIKLCDGMLRQQGIAQINIAKEEISRLLDEVNNLIKEFYDSSLPNNFKLDLIGELTKLQDALINFDIRGEVHLQHICNETISSINTKAYKNPEEFKKFNLSVKKIMTIALSIVIKTGEVLTPFAIVAEYLPLLTDNMSDVPSNSQLKLEAGSEPKKMNAEIVNDSNGQYLPSKKEE